MELRLRDGTNEPTGAASAQGLSWGTGKRPPRIPLKLRRGSRAFSPLGALRALTFLVQLEPLVSEQDKLPISACTHPLQLSPLHGRALTLSLAPASPLSFSLSLKYISPYSSLTLLELSFIHSLIKRNYSLTQTDTCTLMFTCIICNGQKVGATQVSTDT